MIQRNWSRFCRHAQRFREWRIRNWLSWCWLPFSNVGLTCLKSDSACWISLLCWYWLLMLLEISFAVCFGRAIWFRKFIKQSSTLVLELMIGVKRVFPFSYRHWLSTHSWKPFSLTIVKNRTTIINPTIYRYIVLVIVYCE